MTRSRKGHDKIRQGGRSQAFRGERKEKKRKGCPEVPNHRVPTTATTVYRTLVSGRDGDEV